MDLTGTSLPTAPRRRGRPAKTRDGVSTRGRITAATSRLLRRYGYQGTGVTAVLAASDAPKGSLYHYFPGGKEQLAGEAISRSARVVNDAIRAAFGGGSSKPEVVRGFARLLARNLERSNFRDGCPVGTVALDAASESDVIQAACSASFTEWRDTIAAELERAGSEPGEARELAMLLLCGFEGALMMARAQRDTRPLFDVAESLATRLPL